MATAKAKLAQLFFMRNECIPLNIGHSTNMHGCTIKPASQHQAGIASVPKGPASSDVHRFHHKTGQATTTYKGFSEQVGRILV